MGKRKNKDYYDSKIKKKIRKLQKRLQRDRSSSTSSNDDALTQDRAHKEMHNRSPSCQFLDDEYPPNEMLSDELIADRENEATSIASNQLLPVEPNPEPEISEEILSILGEARKAEPALGADIPKELSERWGRILTDGITKEQKEQLLEKMLIPKNFLLAKAPKLNPEVMAVLNDSVKNRDKRLEKSQNQLGSAIAGLSSLVGELINKDMSKFDIIKCASEINQVLLDLHFEESINRRKLITPLLDKHFWEMIQSVKRDKLLFGQQLSENIKNSKMIEKSSQQIKKPPQPLTKKAIQGNYRAPPRPQTAQKTARPALNRYQDYSANQARRSTIIQRNRAPAPNRGTDRKSRR